MTDFTRRLYRLRGVGCSRRSRCSGCPAKHLHVAPARQTRCVEPISGEPSSRYRIDGMGPGTGRWNLRWTYPPSFGAPPLDEGHYVAREVVPPYAADHDVLFVTA